MVMRQFLGIDGRLTSAAGISHPAGEMKSSTVISCIASVAILPLATCRPKPVESALPATPIVVPTEIDAGEMADLGALVIVTEPKSGQKVSSGFEIKGVSRTFESTVNWSLKARDGTVLASGFTSGGGVDGPAAFSVEKVEFNTSERQLAHLEVFEEDASDGEGHPPPRDVIPLVLTP